MPQCALGVEMAAVTLGEAARLTQLNKSTLSRAVKAGRLSATRRDDGSFIVDVSELERVFPIQAAPDAPAASGASDATDGTTRCERRCARGEKQPSADARDARVAGLEAEVRGLRELLAEVRASRDGLQEQLHVALAALPAPRRSW